MRASPTSGNRPSADVTSVPSLLDQLIEANSQNVHIRRGLNYGSLHLGSQNPPEATKIKIMTIDLYFSTIIIHATPQYPLSLWLESKSIIARRFRHTEVDRWRSGNVVSQQRPKFRWNLPDSDGP